MKVLFSYEYIIISVDKNQETVAQIVNPTTTTQNEVQGNPDNNFRRNQLSTISITASATAVIIIIPVVVLTVCIIRRRKVVKDSKPRPKIESFQMESQDRIYDEIIEERSVVPTNNEVTRKDSYQTLNDAIVSVHAYQSVGQSPIDSSQEREIDMQRSNYEPLSRRNIVETENNYDKV